MSTEATFPLIEDTPAASPTPSVGAALVSPIDERAGFGVGLLTPFRRNQRDDFNYGAGAPLLSSEILQVIGVRADNGRMTGELPWRPDFGSLLYTLQFDAIDETMLALVRSRIAFALAAWLPQVKIRRVTLSRQYNAQNDIKAVAAITYDVVQVGTNNLLATNQTVDVPVA